MTTTSELRSKIETQGEQISEIAHKIEDRIEEYTDWRTMVHEYPLQSMAVAVGAGLLLSGTAGSLLRFAGHQAGAVAKSALAAVVMGKIQSTILAKETTVEKV